MTQNKKEIESAGEILVVDDNPANLQLLFGILTGSGYRVRPATNGQLGLDAVAGKTPDLILLDIRMPEMGGFEVCRRLKAQEHSRDIPVIFVSAAEDVVDKAEGFRLGGVDYITKPFEAAEILARVKTHLAIRATETALAKAKEMAEAMNEVLQGTLTCETEEELGKTCLAVAERLTDSKFGYIGELNPAGFLDVIAISNPGWDACEMASSDVAQQLKNMAIRGIDRSTIRDEKSRIVNADEMATHPDRVGTPPGHPAITAFLGVSLKREGRAIGMIGLGNKEGGYNLADQNALEALSVAIVESLYRKRAAIEVQKHRAHLAELVDERTASLSKSNEQLQAEITERKRVEEERGRLTAILEATSDFVSTATPEGQIIHLNRAGRSMIGWEPDEDLSKRVIADAHPAWAFRIIKSEGIPAAIEHGVWQGETALVTVDGREIPTSQVITSHKSAGGEVEYLSTIIRDITERKRAEEAIEKRLVALTQPLDKAEGIAFEDLFSLADIQRVQDMFAKATGVASIITHTDGTPITKPSNFCRLCKDIIRCTEQGLKNCYESDAIIGRHNPEGPIIQPCLSGGLWDAGSSITVGGRHIANWLIGQVRDETQTEDKIRQYAREIDADEEAVVEAFREVTAMSREKFGLVAQALFTLAQRLSTTAYQNVQQARFITERKRAEERLLFERIFTDTIIQSLPGLFYVFEKDSIRFFRREGNWQEVTGYTDEEMDTMTALDFFEEGPDRNLCTHRMQEVYDHGSSSMENRLLTKSGEQIPYYFTGNRFSIDNKTYLVGLGLDISEQKEAEAEREQLIKTLEFKNTEIRDMVYTASHDLKTPLVNIEGFSGELKADCSRLLELHAAQAEGENKTEQIEPLLKQDIPHSLGFITGSAKKMTGLLDGLLQVSRVGTAEIHSVPLDMDRTVREVLAAIKHQINESNAAVTVDPLPECMGDPHMLDRVFANLISNAFKYLDPARKGEIRISGSVEDNRSLYCVADNGIGIDPAHQKKVFEIFHRLNPQDSVCGEGLGLTIVTRILDRLGGTIWLESEPGKGSKFFIALPAVS